MSSPIPIAAVTKKKNEREPRRFTFLKVGYFTLLTIIAERNTSNTGSANFQSPFAKSRSSIQIRKYVMLATKPAAAGMGKPTNSLDCSGSPFFWRSSYIADRQLKRASRSAPQIT